MSSLFDQFCGLREQRVPVALMPGQMIALSGGRQAPSPLVGAERIVFEIRAISANELLEADRVMNAVKPPPMYEEQSRPGTVGMVKVQVGYDFEHPDYVEKRQEQLIPRQALICLFGCPDLMGSTPGGSDAEKAKALQERVPAVLLDWLCGQIEALCLLHAVGPEDVASFFPKGSDDTDTGNSKSSSDRSQVGGNNKPEADSTEQISSTSAGSPPDSGE